MTIGVLKTASELSKGDKFLTLGFKGGTYNFNGFICNIR